jgi:hypothetical protein
VHKNKEEAIIVPYESTLDAKVSSNARTELSHFQ